MFYGCQNTGCEACKYLKYHSVVLHANRTQTNIAKDNNLKTRITSFLDEVQICK